MNSTNKTIRIFHYSLILITSAILIWIGATPSLTDKPFVFDLSIQRFLLFCVVSFIFLFSISSLLILKNQKYFSFWDLIFKSKWIFLFALCISFIEGIMIIGTVLHVFKENTFLFERILPVNCLLFLISFNLSILLHSNTKGKLGSELKLTLSLAVGKIEKGLNYLYFKANLLFSTSLGSIVFLVLINAPIIFINAIRYDFPLGFSGLYTLMSEKLVSNNFLLPDSVPFYGPGGIPYAYPPVGFYIMGFFIGILKIPTMIFLRFAPAIYFLFAGILFYFLIKKISKSSFAGLVSSILFTYSSVNYEIQATSGGIVRGLALVFLLSCLLIYFNNSRQLLVKYFLTSLFFSLTLLTHLGYGFILCIILFAFTLSKPFNKIGWLSLISIGFLSLVLTSPWWITMVSRYGFDVFSNAFGSHGNSYLSLIVSGEKPLLPWLKISFGTFFLNKLFGAVALVGIFYLLFTGNLFPLLIFFLLMLFSEENGRYLLMIGAAAIGVLLSKINNIKSTASNKLHPVLRIILLAFFIFLVIFPESKSILSMKPLISKESLSFTEYIKKMDNHNSTYFLLENIDNQGEEWFPYLLSMTPFVGGWGGEWVNQPEEKTFEPQMWECISSKNYSCLLNALTSKSKMPDYLITFSTNDELNRLLIDDNRYTIHFENEGFALWIKRP
jgi:hypothetical protein